MRALVEMLDQSALHDEADGHHDRDRKEDRQWHRPVDDRTTELWAEPAFHIRGFHFQRVAEKVGLVGIHGLVAEAEDLLQRHRAEGPDHEQRPMGEVHDTKSAEDECQAQCDQRIGRALVEPV